ncbi:MAG: glutathione S-transferase [Pseudomonadota bacterium]
MPSPKLFVFTISHYCEKARWALEHAGIDYELVTLAPMAHSLEAKKLGMPKSSTPYLINEKEKIQGSEQILDWVALQTKSSVFTHSDEHARKIERRLDNKLGIHVRRWYYAQALVKEPKTVKAIFTHNLSAGRRLAMKTHWPLTRRLMMLAFDLGEAQGQRSLAKVSQELGWLEGLLKDESSFLAGDSFSRVDLTAAALIGLIIEPPQHPLAGKFPLPPLIRDQADQWRDRLAFKWARRIYEEYRPV